MIHGQDGIKHARTMLRVPDGEKWQGEELQKINVTPQTFHQPREAEVIFKDKVGPVEEELKPKPILSRQVYIKAG